MILLDGKAVAMHREIALKSEVSDFLSRFGAPVTLAVVLVGDDSASKVYVKNKVLACKRVGVSSREHFLPPNTSQVLLEKLIQDLNSDPGVHGILVQLPLPSRIEVKRIIDLIDPHKDADGLTPLSAGMLWSGRSQIAPCTPAGVMEILDHYQIPISGKKAVVVGRSLSVGRPMAHLLTSRDATVSLCHSRTPNIIDETSRGDIVVVAAGRPRFLGKEAFAKNSVVVDVGIHRQESGKLCGDVRWEEIEGWVNAATPVPGGVGPMTVQMLLENTVSLAFYSRASSKEAQV